MQAQAGNGSATVSWNAAPVPPPGGYRILRADTRAEVSTAGAGAGSAIVPNLPAGLRIAFVVEALHPGVGTGSFPSGSSPEVLVFGTPGGPTVALQVVARGPSSVTVRATVGAVNDGGRPINSYDISVRSDISGRTASGNRVPFGQTFDAVLPCDALFDLCLSGGTVTATATLYSDAGAGAPGSGSATVDPPPPFNVFNNQFVMFVSMGGKCMDRNPFLTLQECDGSAEQLWVPRDLGDLLSQVDRSCLQHEGNNLGLSMATDGNCRDRDDPVRWVHFPQNNPTANPRHYRGEGRSGCIAVLGDVRTVGTRVDLVGCAFNDQDRWFMYTQPPGLPMAAAGLAPAAASQAAAATSGPAGDAPLGAPAVAVLLLPLGFGLVRRLRRARTLRLQTASTAQPRRAGRTDRRGRLWQLTSSQARRRRP